MGTVLVLGSGMNVYREYTMRAAAARHVLVLLQESPVSWQRPYVIEAIQVPMMSSAAVVNMARALANRYELNGVFTYEEPSVELAAAVAAELQLPHNDTACAHRCRDKVAMRQALEQAGVPSAKSRLVFSEAEAATAARHIGYPVVLKPRAMASSMGVVKIASAKDVPSAFAIAAGITHPRFNSASGVLVEEYLDGPEVSVESLVFNREVHVVAVTRKQVGFAPYFEEIGHVVSTQEEVPHEEMIREVTVNAHRALGVSLGATHTELRLTRNGPRVIELGARLGGDLIPHLVCLATGIDLATAAVDIAAGTHPNLQPTRQAAAAIRFLYPERDVRVQAVSVDHSVFDLPWVDQVTWEVQCGDTLRLPPRDFSARLGFIVVTGKDIAECQSRIDQVLRMIHLDLESVS